MTMPKLSSRRIYATLLVFIACMVICYSRTNVTSMNFTVDTDSAIDDALKNTPVCNSNDRPRQRALLTTLHAWSQFAHEHNIRYWIAYGTLVGYVQRGGLLPHDADIDILMLSQDTQYLVPLADRNFSSIYELKVHPQWSEVGYAQRSYFFAQNIDFKAPNARFRHRKLDYHVDIWPMYDFRPDLPRNTTSATRTLTEYNRSYRWMTTPAEWTFPLKACVFSGIRVWCPARPANLITWLYGSSSVNETDRRCVNNTWVRVWPRSLHRRIRSQCRQTNRASILSLFLTTDFLPWANEHSAKVEMVRTEKKGSYILETEIKVCQAHMYT